MYDVKKLLLSEFDVNKFAKDLFINKKKRNIKKTDTLKKNGVFLDIKISKQRCGRWI